MSDYKITSRLAQKTPDGKNVDIIRKYPYDKRENIKVLINTIPNLRTELTFRDFKNFDWIFPVPSSSSDPIGQENSKSYDTKFFYHKSNGVWRRTPISVFKRQLLKDSLEDLFLYKNLPFISAPRAMPVPRRISDFGRLGDQTHDSFFFYIKSSLGWRRQGLKTFSPSKMTIF